MAAGISSGEKGRTMNSKPYLSHSVVMMSHVQISVSVASTTRPMETMPESSRSVEN